MHLVRDCASERRVQAKASYKPNASHCTKHARDVHKSESNPPSFNDYPKPVLANDRFHNEVRMETTEPVDL